MGKWAAYGGVTWGPAQVGHLGQVRGLDLIARAVGRPPEIDNPGRGKSIVQRTRGEKNLGRLMRPQ